MFESHKKFAQYAALVAILTLSLVVATGCGGGAGAASSSQTPTSPSSPSTTSSGATANLAVNMGDAVAERVINFEVTVTSIALTRTDGTTVQVFSGARRIEVTHLAGTFEPFALAAVPQGTYSSAAVTITDPEGAFLANDKSMQKFEDKALTRTVTISFSPALQITGKAAVLNLDVNVGGSLSIDLASNSVTINPQLSRKDGQLPQTEVEAENEVEPENGELEDIDGAVTAVDVQAGTFKMNVGQSNLSLTFETDTTTKFEINDSKSATLGALAAGMLVRVEGKTMPDGTAMAREVEATIALTTGAEAEGLVTSTTGNPVTSFTMIAHDGSGNGILNGAVNGTQLLGAGISVSVPANTRFQANAGKLNIDPAVFPFDAAHFTKGQRVEADSEAEFQNSPSSSSSASLGAKKIKLQKQALIGTVSSFSGAANSATFTLNVAADSAFALLTGQTAIQVQTQAATVVKNTVSLPPSSAATQIRVRGLLFFDGTNYKMAAARVDLP